MFKLFQKLLITLFITFLATSGECYIWTKYKTEIDILSPSDKSKYEEIFLLQDQGKFSEADKILSTVDSDTLKEYVLLDRYLSPRYKSNQKELIEWIRNNPESGLQGKVKALLKSKGNPVNIYVPYVPDFEVEADGSGDMIRYSYNNLSTNNKNYVKQKISTFKKAIRKGNTKNAKYILQDPAFIKLINKSDLDRMAGVLTFSYFLDNQYDLAYEVGQKAADSGEYLASWSLGLINYKKRKFDDAATNFITIYNDETVSSYQRAGGAYWAGKTLEEIDDRQSEAKEFFQAACSIPYSFYGSIGCEKLGKFKSIKWDDFDFTLDEVIKVIRNYPTGDEALALLQVGKKDYAITELTTIAKKHRSEDSALIASIIALSQQANLPNLSIQLSKALKEKDLHKYHSAAYPIPSWNPENGWRVDKAFVYAIAKQESLFKEKASSSVGARGLMQIMPATASFITNDSTLKKNKDKLYEPELNLDIAQAYMIHLIEKETKEPNLVKVLMSYNAGPGNARKWDRKIVSYDDPLLYIESIPSKETRNYVKNVLLNFWFYRSRFNQDNPSLSNLAEDQWPLYHQLDDN